ncbi:MAG: hypothetical protein QF371_00345 [Flavobacteriales bacterium]|nr:hypothetical protein [Flavobacteriales bacterium]
MKSLLVLGLFTVISLHDFHSSVTQVEFNTKTHSLEITVRLFTDDLMVSLEDSGFPKMEIGTTKEPPEANENLEKYLQKHLAFTVNGKSHPFKYLGKEAQDDATWCYLEIEEVASVNKLEVTNTLMLSSFDDQTNMVNLKINGRKKSGLSRKGSIELSFDF